MKSLIFCITLLISNFALAECFKFDDGKGPSKLGSIQVVYDDEDNSFYAKRVCFATVSRMIGGTYESFELVSDRGPLVGISVSRTSIQNENCNKFCASYEGLSGQTRGQNLPSGYEKNIKVVIDKKPSSSGELKYFYTDLVDGKTYSITLER